MPLGAIGLLFGSAILHTIWNLLLKQAGEKYMATWWGMLIGSALFMPALFLIGLPARATWLFMAVSAFAEAAYFVVLSFAYNDADFSLVYPMARGTAPALIAVWAILFLREKLTPHGLLGLVIIVLGLLIVGGSNWLQRWNISTFKRSNLGRFEDRGEAMSRPISPNLASSLHGIWPALLVALLISIYSTIDGAAVKRTEPFAYAAMIYFTSSAYMTPFIAWRHGWRRLKDEFVAHHWRLAAIGAMIVTGYLLALWAYRIAPVSYSGAIREVSVVMGAFAGWQFLGEKFGAIRLIGAVVIFAGILVIALYG